MSVNRRVPHLLVLPEDDANRQIAVGFRLSLDLAAQVRILEVAGGWRAAISRFESDHVANMHRFKDRLMVLLVDFDNDAARLDSVRQKIPERLRERVFVLGVWTEPEKLKHACQKSYEEIGRAIAQDCRDDTTQTILSHPLLKHNASELERLRDSVRPVIFPSS